VTFPGRIGDDMTAPVERWMPRCDWRDMDAIQAWAATVAAAPAADRCFLKEGSNGYVDARPNREDPDPHTTVRLVTASAAALAGALYVVMGFVAGAYWVSRSRSDLRRDRGPSCDVEAC
jgi:hypothetical protein